MKEEFRVVGIRQTASWTVPERKKRYQGKALPACVILTVILTGCLTCDLIMTKDPSYLDLAHYSTAPDSEFLFGTDTMGRDIYSMIWYGGRISLLIGVMAAFISTVTAVIVGSVSGCAGRRLDNAIMRLTDILLSVPNLLAVILLQAVLGRANILSISFVIGSTGWMSMAKVVRTQVRQIRNSEYVLASKGMGGGFFHLLWRHLAPNFVSSIMFMVVMSIRSAIAAESTLSFMGIGLPAEVISWGSMLSLSEQALLSRAWWIILIPGIFLVTTLLCLTSLGNCLQRHVNQKHSNL